MMSPFMQEHALQPKEHTATAWANAEIETPATASSASSVQPLDGRSITASSVRRQYLERELRAAQENLVDIGHLERHHHTISRVPTPTSLFNLFSARGMSTRQNSRRVPRSELDAARQRNEELLARIRDLEAQMESAWALGLSDDPPPGYSI
ncbi:Salicylate hydroxylase [Mycena venus]|uniref:Salicylate hydroxylase n=1 Tax=Mycena venus TaxID=2733690 RepID=A0A8H6X624_9AGAR|nr:Salicylate hydroxylase [Mycena venus]